MRSDKKPMALYANLPALPPPTEQQPCYTEAVHATDENDLLLYDDSMEYSLSRIGSSPLPINMRPKEEQEMLMKKADEKRKIFLTRGGQDRTHSSSLLLDAVSSLRVADSTPRTIQFVQVPCCHAANTLHHCTYGGPSPFLTPSPTSQSITGKSLQLSPVYCPKSSQISPQNLVKSPAVQLQVRSRSTNASPMMRANMGTDDPKNPRSLVSGSGSVFEWTKSPDVIRKEMNMQSIESDIPHSAPAKVTLPPGAECMTDGHMHGPPLVQKTNQTSIVGKVMQKLRVGGSNSKTLASESMR